MDMSQFRSGHTVTAFDDEIAEIRISINAMAQSAADALEASIDALARGDRVRASELIEQDLALDELESELERMIMRSIALRAPVADDLRYLVMAIRIGSMLERCGDHAKNVAKRIESIEIREVDPLVAKLREMCALGTSMLAQAVDCFNREEPDLAPVVRDRDRRLNDLFDEFTGMVTRQMRDDEAFVATGVHLLSIAKQLERVGDYAKNIAASVYYIVTGEHLAD